jgi:SprT protein
VISKLQILSSFLPESCSVLDIEKLLEGYTVKIKITNPRKTKLGDFRASSNKQCSEITINNNLNPTSFLITLLHEIAHLYVWEKHRNKVNPHGNEWKEMFKDLLIDFLYKDSFPKEMKQEVLDFTKKIKASTFSNTDFVRALRKYEEIDSDKKDIEHIEEGVYFEYKSKIYIRDKQLRKRILCTQVSTNRKYLFSPHALVKIVEK